MDEQKALDKLLSPDFVLSLRLCEIDLTF